MSRLQHCELCVYIFISNNDTPTDFRDYPLMTHLFYLRKKCRTCVCACVKVPAVSWSLLASNLRKQKQKWNSACFHGNDDLTLQQKWSAWIWVYLPVWNIPAIKRGSRISGSAGVSMTTLVMSQVVQSTKECKLKRDVIKTLSCSRRHQQNLYIILGMTLALSIFQFSSLSFSYFSENSGILSSSLIVTPLFFFFSCTLV